MQIILILLWNECENYKPVFLYWYSNTVFVTFYSLCYGMNQRKIILIFMVINDVNYHKLRCCDLTASDDYIVIPLINYLKVSYFITKATICVKFGISIQKMNDSLCFNIINYW